jgi:hypothetical protein
VSFIPPDQLPPELAPQDESETPDVDAAVESLLHAIKASADRARGSDDPEAVQRFGQGAFAFAQAIVELLPPKPNPDARLKAEADMVKTGASLASSEAVGRTDQNGGKDGQRTADSQRR